MARRVVGEGMGLTAFGLVVGLVLSYGAARLMSALLFGIPPTDLVTRAGVSVLLAAVALVACYLPARRASRVDPVDALRYD
jgi:putative ABC transport system permease protein